MASRWTIGAQLSTSHSARDALNRGRVFQVLDRVRSVMELDFLVLGSREDPEIFKALCGPDRPLAEVFLWYNLLSDIEGMEEPDLVVNWRGERSRGWGGWAEKGAEVSETFRFVCPNNPAPRKKTLRHLGELLARYPFSGVFFDKLRFPSPANGLDEVISCFCDHCRQAAKAIALDLDAVARMFEDRAMIVDGTATEPSTGGPRSWLDALAGANPTKIFTASLSSIVSRA